jgi:hypothetical protein
MMNLNLRGGVHDGGDVMHGLSEAEIEEPIEERLDVF